MARVGTKNTWPEIVVRKALHRRGFRFRLHAKTLPGRPDIVFPKWSVALFVHGCFWHGHDCKLFRLPKTRTEFWREKISRNRERDLKVQSELVQMGWRTFTVWECALKGKNEEEIVTSMDALAAWLMSASQTGSLRG
jgi:DNA mismatch endonuclease (patch repair protein)